MLTLDAGKGVLVAAVRQREKINKNNCQMKEPP